MVDLKSARLKDDCCWGEEEEEEEERWLSQVVRYESLSILYVKEVLTLLYSNLQ